MGTVLPKLRSAMRCPVTFVVGATGTGKTELSLALARKWNGEIINADAMQLYKGLNIVTNKASDEERAQCPHHLLDILGPDRINYTIHDFKNAADKIISRILDANKLPIIVGGTNYYVDSLIWEALIPNPKIGNQEDFPAKFEVMCDQPNKSTVLFISSSDSNDRSTETTVDNHFTKQQATRLIQDIDTEFLRLHHEDIDKLKLHSLLMAVDPAYAKTFHPHTVRKIIRGIEVYKRHGKPMSEFLQEINSLSGDSTFGARLRYDNMIVLWLQCDQEVLDKRLDSRVDKMLERGLLSELDSFHQKYNEQRIAADQKVDYTKGVFQSIGFKEFHSYLLLDKEARLTKHGQALLEKGISALKTATRRYSRYQHRWVKKQFFQERNEHVVPPVYAFDATSVEKFEQNVIEPAQNLIDDIIRGKPPSLAMHTMPEVARVSDNPVVYRNCHVCGTLCIRLTEWQTHQQSRRHKKSVAAERRRLNESIGVINQKSTLAQTSGEPLSEVNRHGNTLGDLNQRPDLTRSEQLVQLSSTLEAYHKKLSDQNQNAELMSQSK